MAKSSGVFLYTLQQKLKSRLADPSINLNFREDLKDLAKQHSWAGFNNTNQDANLSTNLNTNQNSSSISDAGNSNTDNSSPLAAILAEGTSQARAVSF